MVDWHQPHLPPSTPSTTTSAAPRSPARPRRACPHCRRRLLVATPDSIAWMTVLLQSRILALRAFPLSARPQVLTSRSPMACPPHRPSTSDKAISIRTRILTLRCLRTAKPHSLSDHQIISMRLFRRLLHPNRIRTLQRFSSKRFSSPQNNPKAKSPSSAKRAITSAHPACAIHIPRVHT